MRRTARPAPTGRLALLAGLLFVLLTAVGCGSDEEDRGGPGPPRSSPGVSWGEPASGDPLGLVIMLHGGGWQPNRNGYEQQKQSAATLQARGYATVAIAYGEGARGFRKVEEVYSQARRHYRDLPICASGISAGGHLALMLATREPELACVVDFVGPTDLTSLAEQGGTEAHLAAVEAFGEDQLAKFSPIRYADRIEAKVLMVLAKTDPVNPVEQGRELVRALPSAELVVLPAGPVAVPWAHGATVRPEAQDTAITRQLDFIDEATQGS